MSDIRFLPSGDCAVTIEYGKSISEKINDRVMAMYRTLSEKPIYGIKDMIPAYCSLTVIFDKRKTDYLTLTEELKKTAGQDKTINAASGVLHKIPVCYGLHFGRDMENVQKHTGLSRAEIISLHSGTDYRIYMMGFLPGFVYLGGMNERLVTPRLKTPRLEIPAGSVGIGGNQTGVYPLKSPGGWQLIGATPVNFYDPGRQEPVLCNTGDIIRFVPVSVSDYYDIRYDVLHGRYVDEKEAIL